MSENPVKVQAELNIELTKKEEASSNSSSNISDDDPKELTKSTMIGIFLVYFSVFLGMMGMSIVQPVLPFYAYKFGANSTELGALYSSYSGMALVSTFVLGKISDTYGRRIAILIALFGTALGFGATGLAQDYWGLLGLRFFAGTFGGSTPVAQAYVTDLVPSKSRPRYLAAIGACIALAYIIGPGIGSGLSEFGVRVPFFVSSGLGFAAFIFALFLVKESHPRILEKQNKKKNSNNNISNNNNIAVSQEPLIKESSDIPKLVWLVSIIYLFDTLAWTTYTSMFTLYVIDEFGLNTLEVGYVTLSLAIVYVFANLFVFGMLVKNFGLYVSTLIGSFLLGLGFLLIPFMPDLWSTLSIMTVFIPLGNGVVMPCMASMAANFSNSQNRGKVLSFNSAFSSIAFVIGPLAHGALFDIDNHYPFFLGSACAFVATILTSVFFVIDPSTRGPAKVVKTEDTTSSASSSKQWKFVPDQPTEKDFNKLGKYLGDLLGKRGYKWVTHYDKVERALNNIFVPVRTSSLEEHLEDIEFIKTHIDALRQEYHSLESHVNFKLQ